MITNNNISSFAVSLALAAFPLVDGYAIDFEQEVLPILKHNCIECHSTPMDVSGAGKKPKGDLILDSKAGVLKGGERGAVIEARSSQTSLLLNAVTSPEYDDLHMPPKGRPLNQSEIQTIRDWIDSGADFGSWMGNVPVATAAAMPIITDKEEPPLSAFDFIATKAKADVKKGETFVFKGFYLGHVHCGRTRSTQSLSRQGASFLTPIDAEKLHPEVRGAQVLGNGPYRIYLKKNGVLYLARHWLDDYPFARAESDGVVNLIWVTNDVRNKLFNSANTPRDEFLQTFVNAYSIPELNEVTIDLKNPWKGVDVGLQKVFQYRSPNGYEINYYDKTLITDTRNALSEGEEMGTITIRRIASESQDSPNSIKIYAESLTF